MIHEKDRSSIQEEVTERTKHRSAPWWRSAAVIGAVVVALVGGAFSWFSFRERSSFSDQETGQSSSPPTLGSIPRLSISYGKLGPRAAITISEFEVKSSTPVSDREQFDSVTKYEGRSSLELRSTDHRTDVGTIRGRFDFSRMQLFDAMFYVTEAQSVESLGMRFRSRTSAAAFEYPLSVPAGGWIPVRMNRDQFVAINGASESTWADIGVVEIRLVSRPRLYAQVHVDLMQASGDLGKQTAAWTVADENMLGLTNTALGTALLFRSTAAHVGTLTELADSRDFILTVRLSPITAGRGGLFFRGNMINENGYSFVINGVGSRAWQLLRTDSSGTKVVREGTLPISSFRTDEAYWLRSVVQGDRIDVSLSVDGTNFIRVARSEDGTFDFGRVGVVAYGATYAIHEIQYQRK